ncbi:MAG TPA: MMPL family transporter, partial [Longimicrobiales bacterium]|nr:MMPL family transporter [Longimicrobiales bacterium]
MPSSPKVRLQLARMVVRRRALFIAAWVLVALVFVPRSRQLAERLQGSAAIEGSESSRVEQLMRGPLASSYGRYAVLVVRGLPSPATAAGADALRRIVEPLAAAPLVAGVLSWLTFPDPRFVGAQGEGTVVMVGLAQDSAAPDRLIAPLRALTGRVAGELTAEYPAVTLRWSGETALNVDLRATSSADVERAERRALPVTALLLLFAFGAVAAALLPVAAGALGIAIALGAAAIAAELWSLSLLLQSVVTMLGLGLGIDYALLMVSRFRDGLADDLGVLAAAEEAARHAGHTILLSAATVALGFIALLIVPMNELRAVAAGGLLVVAVSALLATTLLPGVLAMLGPRIDWGRVVRRSSRTASLAFWRRWGLAVTGRPWLALAGGGLPLLLLAAQSLRLETGMPRGDWLPSSMESARALDDLEVMGRAGVIQAIRVVIELPFDASLWQPHAWESVRGYAASLARDPRVARVQSLVGTAEASGLSHARFVALPPELRSRLTRGSVSADGRLLLIELIPGETVSADGAVALVREIRGRGGAALGIPGARARVGGLPAFNADYHDTIAGRFPWIIALIVAGTMLALFAGFRSVLIPLKAIALNLLSVAGAFGAVTLVFQEGHGAALVGVAEPVGAVFSSLPVLVFCVVFGLSMDYEIFLITRVREIRRSGAGDREAIVEALGRTGKVITNAAGVMLVVFAAFTLGDVLITKMLGFALAVAVLLDATL